MSKINTNTFALHMATHGYRCSLRVIRHRIGKIKTSNTTGHLTPTPHANGA
jgi:hypothetical protein